MTVRKTEKPAPKLGLTAADKQGNAAIATALKSGPLASGTTSDAARWTNRLLSIAGFETNSSSKSFDGTTATAIQRFQSAEGLPVTGQLDEKTFTKLQNVELRVRTHKDQYLGVGQKSVAVKAMEERLNTLGYKTGPVDGIFDEQDATAMKAFRASTKDLTHGTSVLTSNSGKELQTDASELNHVAYRGRVKPSKAHTALDAQTAKAAAKPGGIVANTKSSAVANIQAHLRAAGFNPDNSTGQFTARTRGAVEAFQRQSGLPVTGAVDTKTWAKLKSSYIYANGATRPVQSLDERDADVGKTKNLLREIGYKNLNKTNIYGTSVVADMKKFEKNHGLKVTGNVGAKDLAALKADAASKEKNGTKAFTLAHSLLGQDTENLKFSGPLKGLLDTWVSDHECCANFVSACLEKEGLIPKSMHNDVVSGLATELGSDKNFEKVSLKDAKPGDVVCFDVPGEGPFQHTEMFAGWSNGEPIFIGSNNVNPDGSQRISEGNVGYTIDAIYHYKS